MARHPIIRPALCCALDNGEIRALQGFYGGTPSIKVNTTVYNLSSKTITYFDNRYGVINATSITGDHRGRSGVSVIVTLEVPTDFPSQSIGTYMNELISAAVEQGNVQNTGRCTVYEYGFTISEYNLVDSTIHKDAVSGILIGVGSCDWRSLTGSPLSSFAGRESSFRGHLQAVEYVDDNREAIYIAGVKSVDVVRATPSHIAGRKPGVYVSKLNDIGELEVKTYSTCELCRAEENLAIFERHSEAESFMDNLSMPSGKKAASGGSGFGNRSISERLRDRAERHPNFNAQPQAQAQATGSKGSANTGSARGATHSFDHRSRYERASGGRSWFVLVMELLDSLMGQIIRMTHRDGFGKWFSTGGQ